MRSSLEYTFYDKIFDRLIDFQEEIKESEIALGNIGVCLEQFHLPLERRLQKVKAIQQGCLQTLHLNEPLFREVKTILSEQKGMETIAYPVSGVSDDRQPFFDFCQKIVRLESVTNEIRKQLEAVVFELGGLSNDLEDTISDIVDLNDDLESKVSDCFDSVLDDVEY